MRALRHRLVIALAVAWVAALVPLWGPRLLPLRHLPDALAAVGIWQRIGDPSWGYQTFWTARPLPLPPIAHQLFLRALGALFSIDTANRIFLSLYAAALPISVAWLARRFHRSPWLALLVMPFAWSRALGEGHVAPVAGVVIALGALAAYDKLCEAISWRRAAAWLALISLLVSTDPGSYSLFVLCAVPVLLSHRPWRTGRVRPSLLPIGALLLAGALLYIVVRAESKLHPLARPGFDGSFEPASEGARLLAQRLLTNWPGMGDEIALLLLGAAWFLLATTAHADDTPPEASALRRWLPETCFTVAAAAYVATPVQLTAPFPVIDLKPRIILFAVFFGALLVRGPIAGRRLLLLAPAAVAAVTYPLLLAHQFRAFDDHAAGFTRLIARVPRGAPTLILNRDATDPAVGPGTLPYAGFHARAALLVGGPDPHLADPGHPIRALRPAPPPFTTNYEYVITRAETADNQIAPAPARLVARDGAFRLYATRPAPAPTGATRP